MKTTITILVIVAITTSTIFAQCYDIQDTPNPSDQFPQCSGTGENCTSSSSIFESYPDNYTCISGSSYNNCTTSSEQGLYVYQEYTCNPNPAIADDKAEMLDLILDKTTDDNKAALDKVLKDQESLALQESHSQTETQREIDALNDTIKDLTKQLLDIAKLVAQIYALTQKMDTDAKVACSLVPSGSQTSYFVYYQMAHGT